MSTRSKAALDGEGNATVQFYGVYKQKYMHRSFFADAIVIRPPYC